MAFDLLADDVMKITDVGMMAQGACCGVTSAVMELWSSCAVVLHHAVTHVLLLECDGQWRFVPDW